MQNPSEPIVVSPRVPRLPAGQRHAAKEGPREPPSLQRPGEGPASTLLSRPEAPGPQDGAPFQKKPGDEPGPLPSRQPAPAEAAAVDVLVATAEEASEGSAEVISDGLEEEEDIEAPMPLPTTRTLETAKERAQERALLPPPEAKPDDAAPEAPGVLTRSDDLAVDAQLPRPASATAPSQDSAPARAADDAQRMASSRSPLGDAASTAGEGPPADARPPPSPAAGKAAHVQPSDTKPSAGGDEGDELIIDSDFDSD